MSDHCLKGHKLDASLSHVGGFSCSACHRVFPTHTFLHSCRQCDFDLCSHCFTNRKVKIETAESSRKNKIADEMARRVDFMRKARLLAQWLWGFIPPFFLTLLTTHVLDITLNRSNIGNAKFRIRIGVVVFNWLRNVSFSVCGCCIRCMWYCDEILTLASNSLLKRYPILIDRYGYHYPYENAPISSWLFAFGVISWSVGRLKKLRRKRKRVRRELMAKKLRDSIASRTRARALKRFQWAVKRIIMLNYRAQLLANFVGRKEAEFRKHMKRPLVDANFYKNTIGGNDENESLANEVNLHHKTHGGIGKGDGNSLKMWGRGVKVGVMHDESFGNTCGFGFANAAGTWDICFDQTKGKWLHNISAYHLRWERRDLQRTMAKQESNPKKLMKFRIQAQEEEMEELNALCYGRHDNGLDGQPLEEGTLVEVLQVEGGSILGHIHVSSFGSWGGGFVGTGKGRFKVLDKKSSSLRHQSEYDVKFLDRVVEIIPAECIKRVWLYSIDMTDKTLKLDSKPLKVPNSALAIFGRNSSSSGSAIGSLSHASFKPPSSQLSTHLFEIAQEEALSLVQCRRSWIENLCVKCFRIAKLSSSVLSTSTWNSIAGGIVFAFLFDVLSRNDVKSVKIEFHPVLLCLVDIPINFFSFFLWWCSELLVLIVHAIYRILSVRKGVSPYQVVSSIVNEWLFWWTHTVIVKCLKNTQTLSHLIHNLLSLIPFHAHSRSTSNQMLSSYMIENTTESNGRVWFVALEVSLNSFGVELLIVALTSLGICALGSILSSGVPFHWLERCTKSFLKIFETPPEQAVSRQPSQISSKKQANTPKGSTLLASSIVQQRSQTHQGAPNGPKIPVKEVKDLIGLRCFVLDRSLNEYDSAVIVDVREYERYAAKKPAVTLLANLVSELTPKPGEGSSEGSTHLHNDHLSVDMDKESENELWEEVHRKHRVIQELNRDRLKIDIPHQLRHQFSRSRLSDEDILSQELEGSSRTSVASILNGLASNMTLDNKHREMEDDDDADDHDDGVSTPTSDPPNKNTNLLVFDVKFECGNKLETGIPSCYVHIAGAPPFKSTVSSQDSTFTHNDEVKVKLFKDAQQTSQKDMGKVVNQKQGGTSPTSLLSSLNGTLFQEKGLQEQVSFPMCPNSHPLKPQPSHLSQGSLDQRCCRCFRFYAASIAFHGCTKCHYSVCPKCTSRCAPGSKAPPIVRHEQS